MSSVPSSSAAIAKAIPSPERSDRVAILLCTFDGECFLDEQMNSLVQQSHDNWAIYASDDGSTDATREILEAYQNRLGEARMRVSEGPRKGFAANFMSLVCDPAIEADYIAFCDQDDIWFENRLERGLRQLSKVPENVPALYCSRTRLVDVNGHPIGFSPRFSRPPSFRNALVQSLAGANTMLLNRAARSLLMRLGGDTDVVSHDWMAYLLVSGAGGVVKYDVEPTIYYRQHGDNMVGANSGVADRFVRVGRMLRGTFRDWTERNMRSLQECHDILLPENRLLLKEFNDARSAGYGDRIKCLKASGVYRQTTIGNIGLLLAVVLGKI